MGEIKVGDVVVIMKNDHGYSWSGSDQLAKCTAITSTNCDFKVLHSDARRSWDWSYPLSCLENVLKAAPIDQYKYYVREVCEEYK